MTPERLAEIRAAHAWKPGDAPLPRTPSDAVGELLAEIDALTKERDALTCSHEIVDRENDHMAAQLNAIRAAYLEGLGTPAKWRKFERILAAMARTETA